MKNKPLIIFCGLSGSGKSFNSRILESKLEDYVRINLGILREKLSITNYSRKDTPKLLAMAIQQIEDYHQNEKGSILDANLKSVDLRQCFYDLAKSLGKEVILVETVCSDETATGRMNRRKQKNESEDPKEAKIYFNQKKVWQDTLIDLEENHHLSVIRFNTEKEKVNFIKGKTKNNFLINNIINILENR